MKDDMTKERFQEWRKHLWKHYKKEYPNHEISFEDYLILTIDWLDYLTNK